MLMTAGRRDVREFGQICRSISFVVRGNMGEMQLIVVYRYVVGYEKPCVSVPFPKSENGSLISFLGFE